MTSLATTTRNNSQDNGDNCCCRQDLFWEQAAKTPDAVAVEGEKCSLTYAELNRLSDKLAADLFHLLSCPMS